MMSITVSDAVSNISVRHIEEAADFVLANKAHKPVRLKWAAAAACVALVILGGLLLYHGETVSGTLPEQLAGYGLSAEEVEAPEFISNGTEMPQLTKEDLLRIVRNGSTVHGRIQDCSCVKVVSGNEYWYITRLTLEVIDVISGETEENPVTVVSACRFISDGGEPQGFPTEEALLGCTDGMESIFVLRRVDEGAKWNIGGTDIEPRTLGAYFLSLRLDEEDGRYICNGVAVTPGELSK